MLKLMSHRYVIWTLLTLPLAWMLYIHKAYKFGGGDFFYWTGVLCGAFALASLSITPVTKIFKTMPGRSWLIRQRRYLGLAAFGYLIAHTAYFIYRATPDRMLKTLERPAEAIAWISLVIFLALAVTSNDWSVRKMGPNWKRLQRWTYLATFLGLLHWFWALRFPVDDTVVYGGIFVLLMLYRVVQRRSAKPKPLKP
ncbi:MAG: ferric reductase-like transmembrane domain-containing protein [Henriciella sp.]|nr:ferric reductase-like transmembrane domain-containing protein [Henriciella sp.]